MWAACSGTRAVSLGAAAGVVILWRGMWEMCEASARFLPRGVYYREKYGIKVYAPPRSRMRTLNVCSSRAPTIWGIGLGPLVWGVGLRIAAAWVRVRAAFGDG